MVKNKETQIESENFPELLNEINNLPEDSKIYIEHVLNIPRYIKIILAERGLSQSYISEKLKKTEAEISKWLSGKQNITLRTISKLEASLGIAIINPIISDCIKNNYKVNKNEYTISIGGNISKFINEIPEQNKASENSGGSMKATNIVFRGEYKYSELKKGDIKMSKKNKISNSDKKELIPSPRIGVIKVAISKIFIDESAHLDGENEVDFSITQNSEFKGNDNKAIINITFTFKYKETKALIAEITVQNVFYIENLNLYLYQGDSTQILLPREVIHMLVGMCLGHARALFSHSISGSIYEKELPLVIFDAIKISDAIFPFKTVEGESLIVTNKP